MSTHVMFSAVYPLQPALCHRVDKCLGASNCLSVHDTLAAAAAGVAIHASELFQCWLFPVLLTLP